MVDVRKVAALLFDADGVRVNSTAAGESAWLERALAYDLGPAAVLAGIHGRRSIEAVARFAPAERVATATADIDSLRLRIRALTARGPAPRARRDAPRGPRGPPDRDHRTASGAGLGWLFAITAGPQTTTAVRDLVRIAHGLARARVRRRSASDPTSTVRSAARGPRGSRS